MEIKKIKSLVIKQKLKTPRKNSFGVQNFRSGFFVKLIDDKGNEGFGEGFCNWPDFSSNYRGKYIKNLFEPLIKNRKFQNPSHLFNYLQESTERIKIQSGDFGAINQCIAAIDIASWDLYAKLKKKPLRNILFKNPKSQILLYASGLTLNNFDKFYPKIKKYKFNFIKIKVGFKEKDDIELLKIVSNLKFKFVMVDANQAWNYKEAIRRIYNLKKIKNIYWVEEPVIASANVSVWKNLKKNISTNIAAGENLYGEKDIKKYIQNNCFEFYQPDITKYGGITSFMAIFNKYKKNIKNITPHYLGSGPGLFASAQLISGVSNIPLEFDVTENEIRDKIFEKNLKIEKGKLILNQRAGIGVNFNKHFFRSNNDAFRSGNKG